MLYGRKAELTAIERLVHDARQDVSGALVIRGEPGIGKTVLLDHAAEVADGMRIARGSGVEVEAQLPFAGLHQLLRPTLEHLPKLPAPQRVAIEGVFGLGPAEPAERMIVGLAVLSLLSESGPLLCLIDDAQWLDRPSAEALLFAARRLEADAVAMIFTARDGETPFPAPGPPSSRLEGLDPADASALVAERAGDLNPATRARVLAEAKGNPLALIELPIAMADATDTRSVPLTGRLRAAFQGQIVRLPHATQRLLLVAAAEDTGDMSVILGAARRLSADIGQLSTATSAGLINVDQASRRLAFRHPLVRAAVYQEARLEDRLAAHRALAEVLSGEGQEDRRAWQLAAATIGPDARAAEALARAGDAASARHGHAAAAAAYQRAADLSPTTAARPRLLVQAAEAASRAGELAWSRTLAESAEGHDPDAATRLRLDRVLAGAHAGQGSFRTANSLLVKQVASLRDRDPRQATELLMEAVGNAWFAADRDLVGQAAEQLDAIRLPSGDPLTPVRQVQDWIVSLAMERSTGDLPPMSEVIAAVSARHVDEPRTAMHVCGLGLMAGLDAQAYELVTEVIADCRTRARIGSMPLVLYHAAITETLLGRYRDAAGSAAEALQIANDTGQWQWISLARGVQAYLSAIEGDTERCHRLAEQSRTESGERLVSPGVQRATWALGLLELGNGRPEAALRHLRAVATSPARYQLPGQRCAPDLIEAAVRCGDPSRAAEPFARFEALGQRLNSPAVSAIVERCRALLGNGADVHYRAALRLHEQDSRSFEHARTELLYGEWLRRARRKIEAREQLRSALDRFTRVDARPWADRAGAELNATGLIIARNETPGPITRLTPQERQITRLAAQGQSNRDIAAKLFISHRTVGHHLSKAYAKLGIGSRAQLADLTLDDD